MQPVLKMNVPALETNSACSTFVLESAVFMQKMLFVAVLLCDFYANCADIMLIVLFLCKLWGFYANSAVLMQIVLF